MTAGATAAALVMCLAATACNGVAPGSLLGAPRSASAAPLTKLTGPPADPFAGTPADHWAYGAAGIVLPAAKPAGGYSAAQVETAYQWTKKLLVAANLDPQTLAGGTPTAFANLLTPQQRTGFLNGLNTKGMNKYGTAASTRTNVVSFAPGSTQFIGAGIKVHGTMSAKAVTAANGAPELDIDVDYLFVYAAEPPHHPEQWMRLVNQDGWVVTFAAWPTASPGPAPSVSASGSPINPYEAGQQHGVAGCQAATST